MVTFEPTEDYSELIPRGKKVRERKSTEHTDMFIRIFFSKIDDPEWRVLHRSPLSGYLYIAHRAVRKPHSGDIYDLYNRYYLDNKIAAAVSVRELADAFCYKDTKTVRGWIKQLKEEGAFIIETIDVGQPKPANVYILGEFQATKEVLYYK